MEAKMKQKYEKPFVLDEGDELRAAQGECMNGSTATLLPNNDWCMNGNYALGSGCYIGTHPGGAGCINGQTPANFGCRNGNFASPPGCSSGFTPT
jgi:hypothetical protein